jgi:uroporphyrinogen-III synthase
MVQSLRGLTIGLAEGRQLEELAQMLEKEGATALRCPLVSILDTRDSIHVVAWLRQLVDDRFTYVILMTGEGLRRLRGFASREHLDQAVVEALKRTRTVTRGPKPMRALKEIGLAPTLMAEPPTTDGVIATLRSEPLRAKDVGVQLYAHANPALVEFLEAAGARAHPVEPYVYAPAADADRVVDLIQRIASGAVQMIVFTSSPQVDRLYEVAAEKGIEEILKQGLKRARVAAVGPIVAGNLRERGVRVDISPDRGFVMKNLVQQIKRACLRPPV